jgi:hypothetical protein
MGNNVVNFKTLKMIFYFFPGLYLLNIDHGAIGGADDILTGRGRSGRISKKPDIAPKKAGAKACE